jgi:endonuclease YncB( thermonuclease family)
VLVLKRSIIIFLSFLLSSILSVPGSAALTITGRVIAIADRDTITVFQNETQYKIRLYGKDTPEKVQAFQAGKKYSEGNMINELMFQQIHNWSFGNYT